MNVKSNAPTKERAREIPKVLMTQKEDVKAAGKLNKRNRFIAVKLLPDSMDNTLMIKWLPKSAPGKSIKFEPKGYPLLALLKSHPSETLLAIQAWKRLSP
jgi:hypothetical protein